MRLNEANWLPLSAMAGVVINAQWPTTFAVLSNQTDRVCRSNLARLAQPKGMDDGTGGFNLICFTHK